MLNVSVSDLIRNTLTTEKDKADWKKTFTALLVSDLDPVLAVTMLVDPALQEVYKRQLNIKALITRNQNLGSSMEAGFKELFVSPDYNQLGIHVTRKPIGSDFIMTHESPDIVINLGEQELFEIGGWYIELKATGNNMHQ